MYFYLYLFPQKAGLIETRVVFEYERANASTNATAGLIETRVVFEFSYDTKKDSRKKINRNKSCI